MLRKATGNMYDFISHLWSPVKGRCPYDCSYCYVKKIFNRYGHEQKPLHLDDKELKTRLGAGNFIFVCSGCDLFHPDVPDEWIREVIDRTWDRYEKQYLWHTKNPERAIRFNFSPLSTLCATIESNIPWPKISKAPQPADRAAALKEWKGRKMITIEPLLRHDLKEFADMIISAVPMQVNIGLDSGHNGLPEPNEKETRELVLCLKEAGLKVILKKNIRRLIPDYAELSDAAGAGREV
jgi:hypothetical protein